MVKMKLFIFILAFSLFSVYAPCANALKKSYIVYLGAHSHGLDVSEATFELATESHHHLLATYLGSIEKAKDAILYSYNKHINGFAAMLEEEQVQALKDDPKVVSVLLNKQRQLHTTRSWNFVELEHNGNVFPYSIWNKARYGEDTIIGNIDTGVWPESESFSDHGLGPVPSRWRGICQNNTKTWVPCNRKLIGARYYNSLGRGRGPFTARDDQGHGTHTLSTAGGSFVRGANVFGHGNGTAKGGSPRARVAAYKVCWSDADCTEADIVAAFDDAIHDGVDVLSVSLGAPPVHYVNDSLAIAALHAVQKGITVVLSAGNSGPYPASVENVAPWMFSVGASTIDRQFPTSALLGNNKSLEGQSLSDKTLPPNKYYPLINAADAPADGVQAEFAQSCLEDSLDPEKVKGKIVFCLRGYNSGRTERGMTAYQAGAVAMILANDESTGYDEIIADPHVLPATHISYKDGLTVLEYLNSTKSPVAYVTPARTQLNTKPAPFMAIFSSQGPNPITPEILKPDITAPGVSIIAAFSEEASPSDLENDPRRVPYNAESGTSMSCPHVAGVVGLLRTLYPDWTPSAIKSAIMTTASLLDNKWEPLQTASYVKATPFSYGAGHISPNKAADPGLVYDLTVSDYLNFLCGLGYSKKQLSIFSSQRHECPKNYSILDFNYPSITVPNLSGTVTLTRTVKNVGRPSTYYLKLKKPKGIHISVEPKILKFENIGEEKTFQVTLKAKSHKAALDYVFGLLIWTDGYHYVKSPLVVLAK